MAAVVRFDYYGASASEPAGVTAESGWKFNRADTQSGTDPIPIPTATGQNFSWHKNFALNVTTQFASNISNFTIKAASSYDVIGPPDLRGLRLNFKSNSSYVQSALVAATAGNDDTPSGYTGLVTTSPQQWYAGPVSANSTGRKGDFLVMCLGVGYDYTQGGNSNFTLPNMTAAYDEA